MSVRSPQCHPGRATVPRTHRWRRRFVFLAGLALTGTGAASAVGAVDFRGVMVEGGRTWYALADAATGTAEWVAPDGHFAGYRVGDYDSSKRSLALRRGREIVRLKLSGRAAAPSGLAPADVVAVRQNLRRLRAAACLAFIEQAKSRVATADLVGPGRYIDRLESVAGEDYSQLEFRREDAACAVVTATGTVVALAAEAPVFVTRPPGETLAGISQASGWPLDRLCALNPGLDPGVRFSAFQPVRVE